MTEQFCFEVECQVTSVTAVRGALERVLGQRRGNYAQRARLPLRKERRSWLVAAFESPEVHADIEAVRSAADAWDVVSVSWRRL